MPPRMVAGRRRSADMQWTNKYAFGGNVLIVGATHSLGHRQVVGLAVALSGLVVVETVVAPTYMVRCF